MTSEKTRRGTIGSTGLLWAETAWPTVEVRAWVGQQSPLPPARPPEYRIIAPNNGAARTYLSTRAHWAGLLYKICAQPGDAVRACRRILDVVDQDMSPTASSGPVALAVVAPPEAEYSSLIALPAPRPASLEQTTPPPVAFAMRQDRWTSESTILYYDWRFPLHGDAFSWCVVSSLLAGTHTGLLHRALRDDSTLSYGPYSSFRVDRDGGHLSVEIPVDMRDAATAARRVDRLMRTLSDLMTDEVVDTAIRHASSAILNRRSSPATMADLLLDYVLVGQPLIRSVLAPREDLLKTPRAAVRMNVESAVNAWVGSNTRGGFSIDVQH